jgi:hypothetical protein
MIKIQAYHLKNKHPTELKKSLEDSTSDVHEAA